jgi:hypothetical protein
VLKAFFPGSLPAFGLRWPPTESIVHLRFHAAETAIRWHNLKQGPESLARKHKGIKQQPGEEPSQPSATWFFGAGIVHREGKGGHFEFVRFFHATVRFMHAMQGLLVTLLF